MFIRTRDNKRSRRRIRSGTIIIFIFYKFSGTARFPRELLATIPPPTSSHLIEVAADNQSWPWTTSSSHSSVYPPLIVLVERRKKFKRKLCKTFVPSLDHKKYTTFEETCFSLSFIRIRFRFQPGHTRSTSLP